MITKLRIRNYLSLQNVDVELSQRNVLIGPNMAGKSNLIDCFKFLTHMVRSGLNQAVLDRGGFAEVVWKGSDESRLSLQFHALVAGEPERSYDYTLVIVGSETTGLISVEREHLVVTTEHQVATLVDLSHGQGKIHHLEGTTAFATPGPGHSALEFSVPGWAGTEVRDFIASWRFYHLHPQLMKQINAATNQPFLNENGDNLSSWLLTLQTGYPEEFRLLQQAATDVLPDLEAILTP